MVKKRDWHDYLRFMRENGFQVSDIELEEVMRAVTVPVQRNPNVAIKNLRPHYSNETFKLPQTVYLAPDAKLTEDYVKGAQYIYSDRLWQQYREKCQQSADCNGDTAAQIEAHLRFVLDKPTLRLVHIMAAFNPSNGYDYQVYGVKTDDQHPKSDE